MHEARGKRIHVSPYAFVKMQNRGVSFYEVAEVIDGGRYDARSRLALRWIGYRTVIVYYEEKESYHHVRNVGVTRRRL